MYVQIHLIRCTHEYNPSGIPRSVQSMRVSCAECYWIGPSGLDPGICGCPGIGAGPIQGTHKHKCSHVLIFKAVCDAVEVPHMIACMLSHNIALVECLGKAECLAKWSRLDDLRFSGMYTLYICVNMRR